MTIFDLAEGGAICLSKSVFTSDELAKPVRKVDSADAATLIRLFLNAPKTDLAYEHHGHATVKSEYVPVNDKYQAGSLMY